MTPHGPYRIDPTFVFRAVVFAGFLVMLAASLPGQLSTDSVLQLHEGRLHIRETFAPAAYAMVLGAFDNVIPGTALYVVASGALFFGTLLALRRLRPGMSWLGPVAALAAVLSPALLIYQGVVWKDVLFANLAVGSFVLLAHIAQVWSQPRRPWLALLGLLLMLALAAQIRQNGLIAAGVASVVMAWTVRDGGWRAVLGWSVGGLIAVILTSQAMAHASQPPGAGDDNSTHIGIRILQHYDLLGASAHDRSLRFPGIAAVAPATERAIRTRGAAVYSPERVDYLDLDPQMGRAMWKIPNAVVAREWTNLITHQPAAYLAHRLDVFRWVFLTPMIDSCLPIYVGVDGPKAALTDLHLTAGLDQTDVAVMNYATYFLDTPVYSHLSYAVAAALAALLMLWRREPQDVAMAGLMLAALAFTASFFVISIACDYRYLYFLDLSAVAGLVYLAIDPPWRRASRSAA